MFDRLFGGPKITVGGENLLKGEQAERALIDSVRGQVLDTGRESYRKAVELLGGTKLADRLMEIIIREHTTGLGDRMTEREIFDDVKRIREEAGF